MNLEEPRSRSGSTGSHRSRHSSFSKSHRHLCSRHKAIRKISTAISHRSAENASKPWLQFIAELIVVLFVIWYTVLKACFFWLLPRRTQMKDINQDTILITGGGKGLGRSVAVELAKHKPRQIILWGRHMDTLQATANAVQLEYKVRCIPMVCDVSKREEIYENAAIIKQQYGEVTMLVNNAAIVHGENIANSDEDEYEKTIKTNFLAQVWAVKAFLPDMLRMNHGHIVAVNSMLGLTGLAGASDYCMSKYALTGFMEALHLEIIEEGRLNVHCTNIHPYKIDTGLFAGVYTRFRHLFAAMDTEFVAKEMATAILTNKQQVLVPWTMYYFFSLRSIIPIQATRVIEKFFKTQKAMDSFYGRR